MEKVDVVMKFGRLTVIGEGKHEKGVHKWKCECECGNITFVDSNKLRSGHTKSCGCLQKERTIQASLKHGMSKSRIHKEWRGVLHRCKNPSASHYENYGGRGIKVCDEWTGKDGFINFYKWSMENGYADDLTLDRIDNDSGYSPDNCRWIPHIENCHNRGVRFDNKIGVPGISERKLKSGKVKYRVCITANYKRYYIGQFDNLKDAIIAREKAEKDYWGKE